MQELPLFSRVIDIHSESNRHGDDDEMTGECVREESKRRVPSMGAFGIAFVSSFREENNKILWKKEYSNRNATNRMYRALYGFVVKSVWHFHRPSKCMSIPWAAKFRQWNESNNSNLNSSTPRRDEATGSGTSYHFRPIKMFEDSWHLSMKARCQR